MVIPSLIYHYHIKGGLVKIIFSVTNVCNSRCSMCNVWKTYLEKPELIRSELSTEEAIRVIKRSGAKWLSITGGEPTLRRDLIDIIAEADRSGYILTDFSTNGLLPDKLDGILTELREETKDIFLHVGVSVDGPPEIHEKQRGVKGAWRKAVDSLKILMEHERLFGGRLSYSVIVTPTELNVNSLDRLIPSLEREGVVVKSLSLSPPSEGVQYGVNYGDGNEYHRRIWREVMPRAEKSLSIVGYGFLRTLTRKVLFGLGKLYAREGGLVIPCTALKHSAYVDPYGNVYPCPVFGARVGNVREFDYDLKKVLSSERAKRIREEIEGGTCACMTTCLYYERLLKHPLKAAFAYLRSLTK